MGLHYGALRRPDRAKREVGVRSPRLQIRTVDASSQPWRVAVNMKSSDHSEVVFWIVDPLGGQPFLGALTKTSAWLNSVSTSRPASSWQAARDTDAQENQTAAGLEQLRPADRDSQYSPARAEG